MMPSLAFNNYKIDYWRLKYQLWNYPPDISLNIALHWGKPNIPGPFEVYLFPFYAVFILVLLRPQPSSQTDSPGLVLPADLGLFRLHLVELDDDDNVHDAGDADDVDILFFQLILPTLWLPPGWTCNIKETAMHYGSIHIIKDFQDYI